MKDKVYCPHCNGKKPMKQIGGVHTAKEHLASFECTNKGCNRFTVFEVTEIKKDGKNKEMKKTTNQVERFMVECKRCGWKWLAKRNDPVCCARCKSPYWNIEPKSK